MSYVDALLEAIKQESSLQQGYFDRCRWARKRRAKP